MITEQKTVLQDKEKVYSHVADNLYSVGFSLHLVGYTYLCQAITEVLCGYDCCGITKNLYPHIARLNGTSDVAVERAIRMAITKVCRRGDVAKLKKISNTPAHRPLHFSNREFILVMVNEIQKKICESH